MAWLESPAALPPFWRIDLPSSSVSSRRPVATTAPRLLLLRVFGYSGAHQSLFDRVAQTWRLQVIPLIAGVDLAMRTADPADVLALLDDRLAEQYRPNIA